MKSLEIIAFFYCRANSNNLQRAKFDCLPLIEPIGQLLTLSSLWSKALTHTKNGEGGKARLFTKDQWAVTSSH